MGGKSGKGNRLEQSESQRLEALAGSYRLIALVQTTRLTGGYDLNIESFPRKKPFARIAIRLPLFSLRARRQRADDNGDKGVLSTEVQRNNFYYTGGEGITVKAHLLNRAF